MVIPASLQPKVLEILHLGHFGMQRMKHLARTAFYWPGIDSCIAEVSRACQPCAEHQNKPPKSPVHPWMFPEKPWSRVHVDHAISFQGSNWLVLTDAYSNYPCIHQTSSTSSKATTCWRRTLHISVIRIPWYRIMQRLSLRWNFRNGASQEGSYI